MEDSTKAQVEAEIQEMFLQADKATEPGATRKGEVLGETIEGNVAPTRVVEVKSAGYATIYDTKTGEPSRTNRNMLMTQLSKKRADGTRVFSTVRPDIQPFQGHCKCLLHADDPKRKHWDELGFAACIKANLRSPYEVKRHMMKRHKVEWETMEAERIEAERQDDKNFQRTLLTSLTSVFNTPEAPK